MSKKVLVISASPRKGGNSDQLCDRFVAGTKEAGHDVEKIFLREMEINYCRACYFCRDQGKGQCVIKDDVPEIIDKMIRADVIVLSTPVYFYCMNAQLKTIVDRSVMRWREINDKDFYLIATAAEEGGHAFEGTVKSFRGFVECLENGREAGTILAGGVYDAGEIAGHNAILEAFDAGRGV